MAELVSNNKAKNLSVLNVSGVSAAMYEKTKFGFIQSRGTIISGYKVVATYGGNALNSFGRQKSAKHGAKIVSIEYDPQKNTTGVTYFFDNKDSLNTEDSYYRASMFQSILAARVEKTK